MVGPKSKLNQEYGISMHNNPVPDTRHHHYEKKQTILSEMYHILTIKKRGTGDMGLEKNLMTSFQQQQMHGMA